MNDTIINPPVALKKPHIHQAHGHERVDPYQWMNQRDSTEVLNYLDTENTYTEQVLAPIRDFRETLYQEMVGRIKQTDLSVPYLLRGYWYYSRFEEGKEYPVYCRKKETLEATEEIILDVNELASGTAFCDVKGLTVSPSNHLLAYAIDTVGRRQYTLKIKDLSANQLLTEEVPNTDGNYVWAKDNKTLFYDVKDEETLRNFKIRKHILGTAAVEDTDIYHEPDETFVCYVDKSKSGDYIFIHCISTLTAETLFLDAASPDQAFRVFQPRKREHIYSVEHFEDHFYISSNRDGKNFSLLKTPLSQTTDNHWTTVIPHDPEVLIESFDIFQHYLVIQQKSKAQATLRVIEWNTMESHEVETGESLSDISLGTNPGFDTEILRYHFTSLITPNSVFDYDMRQRKAVLLKQQEVVGGYQPENYIQERVFIKVRDGVEVPASLVYKKGIKKDGSNPLLLYGYGSYGISIDPYFSSVRLSLLDRGFIFAIAHIRGGQEMGRYWYEEGKLLKKKNTFFDFIDIAEYFIREKYTSSQHLYAMGGSAGGLLMGAVINFRPDLFHGIIAAVPFVDVLTTMLDESIPLTTGEFDEWGNPADKTYYDYMLSYSPYDNITAAKYPNILVTTGYHDSQVQYWEPAKWVARLRELKTDQHILLFHCEMEAGHGGKSGRFQKLYEIAMEYGFLLMLENRTNT